MRLGARHAFVTRVLADGRVVDVRPWRPGVTQIAVSADSGPWAYVAFYWYTDCDAAIRAALLWDGIGAPIGAGPCPRLQT